MQMNGLAELITIKRYWEQWSDPPKFEASQCPDVDYAGWASSLGLAARTITDPSEIAGAWQQALAADRPTVLDVHCDPDVPPIPPHATFEQMKDAALALAKGDPDRWSVVKEGLKTKAQELIPRRATT
jgi:pyruvate dehydrogenase (quinone)